MAVAGCGSEPTRQSFACTENREAIARALQHAPGTVAFEDGTRLSECVSQADDDGELQQFGVLVTGVADRLAQRTGDARAATQLGYLVGAARRGGSASNGVQAELVHRLESVARVLEDAGQRAFARGLAAGERTG